VPFDLYCRLSRLPQLGGGGGGGRGRHVLSAVPGAGRHKEPSSAAPGQGPHPPHARASDKDLVGAMETKFSAAAMAPPPGLGRVSKERGAGGGGEERWSGGRW
jgi:hypothetical protein